MSKEAEAHLHNELVGRVVREDFKRILETGTPVDVLLFAESIVAGATELCIQLGVPKQIATEVVIENISKRLQAL